MQEYNNHAPFPVCSIRICIHSFDEHRQIIGLICGIAVKDFIHFQGVNDFIIKVDDAYNAIGRPQSFQVLRSFTEQEDYHSYVGNPPTYYDSDEIRKQVGELATYDLIMISRKNAEWQGILKNMEGELVFRFHTIIECIEFLSRQVHR